MLDDQGVTVRTTSVHERPLPSDDSAPTRSNRPLVLVGLAVLALAAVVVWLALSQRAEQQAEPEPTLPTPSVVAETADRLSWAPPKLTSPTRLTVTATSNKVELRPDRDYIVTLPSSPLVLEGGLRIEGGRNVVLLGGEIVVPPRSEAPDSKQRTGLLLKNQTGTIHIEGLRISGEDLAEGINLDQAERSTVVLQNIHVDTVHGSRDGHHADVLQTWAGPARLRVDGLTGSTEYQGLFLLPQQFVDTPPESFDLRRIVITGEAGGANGGAAYLLWTDDTAPWLTARDVTLVDGRSDLDGMLRPTSVWEGAVELRTSADGAALPAGTPGTSYVSPGYQEGTS